MQTETYISISARCASAGRKRGSSSNVSIMNAAIQGFAIRRIPGNQNTSRIAREKSARNKRTDRAGGSFHPFVSMFSRRTIALQGNFRQRCFSGLRPISSICVGRRFSRRQKIAFCFFFPRELKLVPATTRIAIRARARKSIHWLYRIIIKAMCVIIMHSLRYTHI